MKDVCKAFDGSKVHSLNSLRPQGTSILEESHLRFLSDLEQFEAPFLMNKMMRMCSFGREQYEVLFIEFKKFAALSCFYDRKIAMLSPEVDGLWHEFILFTRQYVDFCDRFLGGYLHHEPAMEDSPKGLDEEERFFELYERTFGVVPSLWRMGNDCSSCQSADGNKDGSGSKCKNGK